MERDEFIRHWNYFCSIAKQLEETSEYVYHGSNSEHKLELGDVYSDAFKQILLLSGAEFENMSKALCFLSGCPKESIDNIRDISIFLLNKYPRIVETTIYTKYWSTKPLEEWHINTGKDKNEKVEGMEWWKAYNGPLSRFSTN